MTDTPILILGASGSFGGAVAGELLTQGRWVRTLARDPAKVRARFGGAPGLEVVAGDVQDRDELLRAAAGCGAIVHGVNYPYPQWRPHMATATANVIAAAKAAGATILFPGNVYGLGRQTSAPLDESAAMLATGPKGRLRIELEEELRAGSRSGAPCIVLRAGDFYGPTVRNGLVDRMFGAAVAGKPMAAFGRLDIPHQWAYVPDLARVAVGLLDRRDDLAAFEIVHFAGHVANPARAFLARIAELAGHRDLAIRVMPWWLLWLAGRFDLVMRELLELRYLFDESVILADGKLPALLPDWRPTPLDRSISDTLDSYRSPLAPRD